MPSYERLDYGSPDGSQWGGASTDALGMYGVTPVTQQLVVGGNVSAPTNASTAISSLIQALVSTGIVRVA